MEEQSATFRNRVASSRLMLVILAALACAAAFASQARAAAPANDNFAEAAALSGDPATASGVTDQATRQTGEPTHGDSSARATVWYRWTATQSGSILVDACDEGDVVEAVGVYTGSAVNSLTKIGTGYCRLTFTATAGTEYSIAIASYADWTGPFDLEVRSFQAPANDDFAAATEITGDSVSGSTLGATKQAGEPGHGDSGATATVWYTWTPSESGTASVSACGSYYIDAIAAYTGDQVGSLTKKASGYCQLGFAAIAGTTYRIAVASYPDYQGDFDLKAKIVHPPANDNFAAAATISAFPVAGNTEGATLEAGEPLPEYSDASATVWYKVSFANAGTYVFDACDSDTVQSLAVYSGTTLSNLAERGSSYCKLNVQLAKSTLYYIAVGSYSDAWGEFSLKAGYYAPVANDDFASAATLATGAVTAGSNVSASRQAGEPYHDGADGGHSVWYAWTPSQDGAATVDVCANFDSVLAVYKGSALGSLTKVASDDDSGVNGCSSMSSSVTFDATANTTYRLAVDGYGESEAGNFNVRVLLGPPRIKHALTVWTSGDGAGEVFSYPEGIECGSTCTADFVEGDLVTLYADPAWGSTFAGWSGACSGTDECEVTMSQARDVTARFDRIPVVNHDLNLTFSGSGNGRVTGDASVDCTATCVTSLPEDAVVTLRAVPGPGSTFTGWSGACAGIGDCTVEMSQVRNVTASFEPIKRRLTVSAGGPGTITSSPAGISCGSTCSFDFAPGTVVTLTATPRPGSTFGGWSGGCSGMGACTLEVTEDTQVTGSFGTAPSNPVLGLTLTPRVANVKAGKKVSVKATVASIGNLDVMNTTLCVVVPKKLKKTIKGPACAKYGLLSPGSSWTSSLRIRTTAKAKGKIKLKVTLTSANAPAESNFLVLKVKPKPKKKRR